MSTIKPLKHTICNTHTCHFKHLYNQKHSSLSLNAF